MDIQNELIMEKFKETQKACMMYSLTLGACKVIEIIGIIMYAVISFKGIKDTGIISVILVGLVLTALIHYNCIGKSRKVLNTFNDNMIKKELYADNYKNKVCKEEYVLKLLKDINPLNLKETDTPDSYIDIKYSYTDSNKTFTAYQFKYRYKVNHAILNGIIVIFNRSVDTSKIVEFSKLTSGEYIRIDSDKRDTILYRDLALVFDTYDISNADTELKSILINTKELLNKLKNI